MDSQAREMDRQEQDSEFEMALAADQAREQAESVYLDAPGPLQRVMLAPD